MHRYLKKSVILPPKYYAHHFSLRKIRKTEILSHSSFWTLEFGEAYMIHEQTILNIPKYPPVQFLLENYLEDRGEETPK